MNSKRGKLRSTIETVGSEHVEALLLRAGVDTGVTVRRRGPKLFLTINKKRATIAEPEPERGADASAG
jgi:hypothetical protein